MKNFTPGLLYVIPRLLLVTFVMLTTQVAFSQAGVLNPNDTIAVYNPSAPPTTPAYGTMVKWVKTNRLSWNTSSFKSYYYKGIQFRLKFPKTYQHGVNDGKKYPVFIFFHGIGESGSIYDNEYQLYHGGQNHMNAVDNGVFDGFLLYPQSVGGTWTNQFGIMNEIVQNYLVPQVKADPWRIYVDGLSGGGAGAWKMMIQNPKTVAACLPISNSTGEYTAGIDDFKYTPIWEFQGGLDTDPSPASAQSTANTILAAGSNFKMTIYPNLGHGCWNTAWAEPDFYPFMLRAYKSNPWVLYGRTDFCVGDNIDLTVGVTQGFTSYQWRKNGITIPGATGNSIHVTEVGSYDCQINNNGSLSEWSRIPLVVKYKTTTITPDITASGSRVLPTVDGSDGVKLQLPDGYASYEWRKDDTTSAIIATTQFLTATTPGNYYARVTEQYGCSNNFSNLFKVIDGNGPNGPDAPTSLSGEALGITSIKLSWNQNASPANNETGFEIYQGAAASGPFSLIKVTDPDASSYTVTNLKSFTNYYFKLRAINDNAASQPTNVINVKTLKDTTAPTAPANLAITYATKNQVILTWGASSDDVGVVAYDVYVNGIKSYTTTATSDTANALTTDSTYNFMVKARDFQGNVSVPSNQATATLTFTGLNYKYYAGIWNNLPNFSTLTSPGKAGNIAHPSIPSGLPSATNYAVLFEGFIKIINPGTYTFRLTSDEGSKLFINTPYSFSGPATINNDGIHTSQSKDGTVTLAAGVYPITIAYFQRNGSASVSLSWKVPGSSTFSGVPDNSYTDAYTPAGTAPSAPSGLTATASAYNKIALQWTDNSNNETAFELYRSNSLGGTFTKIASIPANTTAYTDSALNPSATYYYTIRTIGKYGESSYDQGNATSVAYAYYEGSYTALPNFNALTPKKTGTTTNFNINVATAADNFAIKFTGIIKVPATGSYTFYTNSDDGSQLFMDGTLVVNNDGAHGATEKSGVISLTQGYHNIVVTYFEATGGQSLTTSWAGPGLSKQAIPNSVLAAQPVSATTPALPGAAAIPTNLIANVQSSSSIALTWANNDNTVSKFEVYRSSPDNSFYTLAGTVPGSTTSYADSGLTSNTSYYYEVRASNVGGYSGFSNEASTSTLNNIPVLTDLQSKNQRYGTSWSTPVTATDADNESLTISFNGLPAFAYFTGTGNGTGTLTSNPQQADTGTYSIQIIATDTHGGADTSLFKLIVNNSQPIVLDGISGMTITEGSRATVNLTGNYQPTDSVTVTTTNLPSFATLVNNGNNSFAIIFNPAIGQKGTYSNIIVTATNAFGESSNQSFNVNVVEKATTNVNINFNPASGGQPGTPWNSTGGKITAGSIVSNLKDTLGNATGVNMTFADAWDGTATSGAVTNANTGVYPDAIMKTLYYSAATTARRIQFSNLSASSKYDFVFFSSRSGNAPAGDNRITQFTIGGQTVSMSASPSNTTRTVQITGVSPDVNGMIEVGVVKDPGSLQSNLNAMIVKAGVADGPSIGAPAGLTATTAGQTKIKLDWPVITGNPSGVEIWRSAAANGAFSKVATVAGSIITYTDSLLSPASTYYYKLRVTADTLVSAFSAAAFATTLANVTAAPPATVTATGTASDKIRLDWTAGTGTETGFEIWRSSSANGTYTKIATVGNVFTYTDQNLALLTTYYYKIKSLVNAVTSDFSSVASASTLDNNIPSIYVNFSTVTSPIAPWNNTNAVISAGSTFSNLTDATGTATGTNLTLVQGWVGTATSGAVTNTNTGVYPDAVMKTFYYDTVSTAKNVLITGLSSSRKYDFTFFASRSGNAPNGDNRITYYSIGSQTVSLAASPSNTSRTVQIRGISPDANGQVQINIQRDAGAVWAQINALVITPRLYDGTPYAPENLAANGIAKDKIKLDWTLSTIDQTNIEIWRSTSQNGTYSLVGTVGGSVTTYTNTGLSTGAVYFYKIRAVKSGVYSPYTTSVGASTYIYNVNINLNDGSTSTPGEPGAWNNTNALISNGYVLSNLINDQFVNTGMSMSIIDNFSGYNYFGAVTGNNSGLYSDNVIEGFYYVNFHDTARIQFSGLNQSMLYTFSFFGSTTYQPGTITTYTIGNQVATLDSWQNIANTTLLKNIQPDENGSVLITIASSQGYGYLNELSVMASPSPYPVTLRRVNKNTTTSTSLSSSNKSAVETESTAPEISAYPNPFVDDILLKLNLKQDVSNLSVILTDMTGRPVRLQSFSNLKKGIWQQKLGLNGKTLSSGIYFVRVAGIPGEKDRVIKVMK